MQTLNQIGEHEAIGRLTQHLGGHPLLRVGIGDDCAVTRQGAMDQVFTTDPIVEGVHFFPDADARLVGCKAVGRVLSDIAAMGALPQWLLVNIVAPASIWIERLEQLYAGMREQAGRFGATIIGGDLAEGPVLEVHVFGMGRVPAGRALLRSGAKVGDCIAVTGPLGGSIAGKHLTFTPRVEEGIFLRASGVVHAMMDISDGLATDLRHILKQSGVGARLDGAAIPVSPAAQSLEQALYDGEDFELLFTVPPDHIDRLSRNWRRQFDSDLFWVGRITGSPNVLELLRDDGSERVLESKAFEHFRL